MEVNYSLESYSENLDLVDRTLFVLEIKNLLLMVSSSIHTLQYWLLPLLHQLLPAQLLQLHLHNPPPLLP